LVTHALWLSIDQSALGVGGTEDVGTGTCQGSQSWLGDTTGE
jgi:hypothetical protein